MARALSLHPDAELHLLPAEPADPTATVTSTADAALRLIYGRHRPKDDITASGAMSLDDLTALFPGY